MLKFQMKNRWKTLFMSRIVITNKNKFLIEKSESWSLERHLSFSNVCFQLCSDSSVKVLANIILDTGDCSSSVEGRSAEAEDSKRERGRGRQKCHPEISGCTSILSIGQSTRSEPLFSSLLWLSKRRRLFLSPPLGTFHVRFLARGINYGTFRICL